MPPWRALMVVVVAAAALWALSGVGGDSPDRRVAAASGERPEREAPLRPRPQVVRIRGAGTDDWRTGRRKAAKEPASTEPDSSAEVRRELADLRRHLRTAEGRSPRSRGSAAALAPDGTALPPIDAPAVITQVIDGANAIAKTPYRWGGGHGAFEDDGYDCSGSISFALAGAGLLDRPLDSSSFARWGAAGEGRWLTVYTNPGHAFMVVAGLRFDTSGRGRLGTRWQPGARSTGGYTARHFPGL